MEKRSGDSIFHLIVPGASTEITCLIEDNGIDFDPERVSEGNRLVSLRRRVRSLGGEITVSSVEGRGINVTIKIPYSYRR